MPVVFRLDGFKFFFYSNEGDPREPPHVHITKGGAKAKFWLRPVALASNFAFDARTVARIGSDGGSQRASHREDME
jgi:hypothetical protein